MVSPPVSIISGFSGSKLLRTGPQALVWQDLVWIAPNDLTLKKDQFLKDILPTANNNDLSPTGIFRMQMSQNMVGSGVSSSVEEAFIWCHFSGSGGC